MIWNLEGSLATNTPDEFPVMLVFCNVFYPVVVLIFTFLGRSSDFWLNSLQFNIIVEHKSTQSHWLFNYGDI